MYTVSQLFTYPVKSLGGVSLASAPVTERGFIHDRRWLLVDENCNFMSQRTFIQMALLQVFIKENCLLIQHKKIGGRVEVPFAPVGSKLTVTIWEDVCESVEVSAKVSEWFSDIVGVKCKLVYMPDSSKRRVDPEYAINKELTGFSDAYPFMMIGQSSLDDLNSRLAEQLTIDRFRPNIVFTGGSAYEEDEWAAFSINNIDFFGIKLCARCTVITINQNEAVKGKEPLRTLATYRMFKNKIYFGQNLLHQGQGKINVGDAIEIKERKRAMFSH